MNKIKICHFADHINGKADGIFSHILSIIEYTDKSNYQHFLCFQGGEIIKEKIKKAGCPYYVLNNINEKIPLKSIFQFFQICRKEKFSIIHTHYLKPYIISALLKPFFGYRVIYNFHGLFIKNEYNKVWEQKIYQILHWIICKFKMVDLAIVPSNQSKKILLEETKHFPKIEVYYNSAYKNKNVMIRTTLIEKIESFKKDYFLIGIIAHQTQQKRIDIALNILSILIDDYKNVLFVFLW